MIAHELSISPATVLVIKVANVRAELLFANISSSARVIRIGMEMHTVLRPSPKLRTAKAGIAKLLELVS